MKTPYHIVLALVVCSSLAATAGERPAGGEGAQSRSARLSGTSFEEFAAAINDDFNEFRTAVIENYAKWLDGEWEAFQPKMLLKPEPKPKPEEAPVKNPSEPAPAEPPAPRKLKPTPRPDLSGLPADRPDGHLRPKTGIDPLVDRPSLATAPSAPTIPPVPITPATPASPSPSNPPATPAAPATPPAPATPAPPAGPQDRVNFFGMDIYVPKIDFGIIEHIATTGDMAKHWKHLDSDPAVRKAAMALYKKAGEMGLNGYLTYELMRSYAEGKFPKANAASITGLTHYMLANTGFDVRLAQTNGGIPLLLMPFDSQVYGISYITLDGRDYTVFLPSGFDPSALDGAIYTARLPKGADAGRVTSLELQGLNLPEKPRSFDISAGPLHLTGTLNENIFPLVYRYPQMPTEGYAASVLMPGLRRDLVAQVKAQLGGMTEREAVNGMLKFFHEGLDYATDQEYHGFEKPYFLEETLYYPKCDCEDRAIMMTYLLWEALGLENQLLAYPGHESAAVHLSEPIKGTAYSSDGKVYYSCDPTYIGSTVGDCMPMFRNESPTVDRTLPGRR